MITQVVVSSLPEVCLVVGAHSNRAITEAHAVVKGHAPPILSFMLIKTNEYEHSCNTLP
jgi:hypothetical protein